DLHSGAVVIAQPGDDPVAQGHVNFLPAAAVEVGNPAPGQHQVRRGLPPGYLQPPRQPRLGSDQDFSLPTLTAFRMTVKSSFPLAYGHSGRSEEPLIFMDLTSRWTDRPNRDRARQPEP